MFALDTLTVDSQVAFRLRDEYFSWGGGGGGGRGGLMCGMKIPQQDFVLKMQGRLMREGWGGGHICVTLLYLQIPHLLRQNCLQVTFNSPIVFNSTLNLCAGGAKQKCLPV